MYSGPNDTTPSAHIRRTTAVVCVTAPSPITGGCGDNDVASDGTISRAAWDDRFDEICIAVSDELSRSAPAMTEAEFAASTTGAVTVVCAPPLRDDGAHTVRALLDEILPGVQAGPPTRRSTRSTNASSRQ